MPLFASEIASVFVVIIGYCLVKQIEKLQTRIAAKIIILAVIMTFAAFMVGGFTAMEIMLDTR